MMAVSTTSESKKIAGELDQAKEIKKLNSKKNVAWLDKTRKPDLSKEVRLHVISKCRKATC